MSNMATEIENLYFDEGLDVDTIAVRVNWPTEQVRFYVRKLEQEVVAAGNDDTLPTEEEINAMARYYGEE
jgi:hypothetical protein